MARSHRRLAAVATVVSAALLISATARSQTAVGDEPSGGPAAVSRHGTEWQPGDPVPVGFHIEQHPRMSVIYGGAITFGASYGMAFVWAIAVGAPREGDHAAAWLALPIAGPIVLATQIRTSNPDLTRFLDFLLVQDAITQVVGAAVFAYGMTSRRPEIVPDRPRRLVLHVDPFVTPAADGITVSGQF